MATNWPSVSDDKRYRFLPRLEVLEGRALPSTLVVHNTTTKKATVQVKVTGR